MKQYIDLINDILQNGTVSSNRTGVDTVNIFGYCSRYDLREGFPIVTSKRTWFKGCKYELKWFLEGPIAETRQMNIQYLTDNQVHIWDAWADECGDLGPVYGVQWRMWKNTWTDEDMVPYTEYIDQLQNAIETIKKDPSSRRIIVTAWNPSEIKDMALPPCHSFFQFNVDGEYLDMSMYQRSADVFLGVPFNIVEYALLLEIVARITGKTARYFVHMMGNAHIYTNHLSQVKALIKRPLYKLPKLVFDNEIKTLEDFDPEKCHLEGYVCGSTLKGEVAV